MVQDEAQRAQIVAAHARWDASDAPHTAMWLGLASASDSFEEILSEPARASIRTMCSRCGRSRTTRAPECARWSASAIARWPAAKPDNIDLQYVAARCIEDEAQREQAFADLYARAPQNGWLAFAVGYTHAEHARWSDASAALDIARQQLPSMRERLALDAMRVRRVMSMDDAQGADLATQSATLTYYMTLQSGAGLQPGADMAYYHLGRAR